MKRFDDIRVTESPAEIGLRSLVDHTSSQILECQKPVFDFRERIYFNW